MITATIYDGTIIIRTHQQSAVKIIQNSNTYYAKRNANHFSFFDSDDFFNDILDILGEENHLTFPVFEVDFVHAYWLYRDKNFNHFQLKVNRNANDELRFDFATQDGFFLEIFLTVVLNRGKNTVFYYGKKDSRCKDSLFDFFNDGLDDIIEKANKAFEKHEKKLTRQGKTEMYHYYTPEQNIQILRNRRSWLKRQL